MKSIKVFFLLLACICNNAYSQSNLVTYKIPDGVKMKNDFNVMVRIPGKEWKQVCTYLVKVDKVLGSSHHVEDASFCYFDFSGEVEVSVSYNHGKIESNKIRPLSYNISSIVNDSSMIFKLNNPCNLSIEINGDIYHNLHLFANPIEKNLPKKLKSKNLIYFAPGVHQLPGDTLNIPSGKSVYVAGGAVVKGCLRTVNARDIKIFGRGIVRPEGRGYGVEIVNSKNVTVEGIITSQCPVGGSDSITVTNVKSFTHYGWGDGMNVFASNNVLFDGVFCRNSDDCTTVYATRKGYVGGCKNITMRNSVLWADVAHPIFIGLHGNTQNPDVIENVSYVNIDILDHKEKQLDYQGCMSINAGDNNTIRNIRFENIRVENFRQGQLVNMRICYNKKYCTAPGRGIENVLFKNITYNGDNSEVSIISGYNEERKIRNIRFENLNINGKVFYDDMPEKPKWYKTSDMCRFFIGEHVENIEFVK